MKPTKAEREWIEALRIVISARPDGLWLFNNGTMHVMRYDKSGQPVHHEDGSVDGSYRLDSIEGISSDGGDW